MCISAAGRTVFLVAYDYQCERYLYTASFLHTNFFASRIVISQLQLTGLLLLVVSY